MLRFPTTKSLTNLASDDESPWLGEADRDPGGFSLSSAGDNNSAAPYASSTKASAIGLTPDAVDDDGGSTAEDMPTTFTEASLLANDFAGDGTTTITAVGGATNGSVVLNGDRSVTFTPTVNYSGPASFTYTITDSDGDTDTATVTLAVTAVNDSPILSQSPVADVTYTEGQAGSGAALLQGGSAFDVDAANFAGGSLTVSVSGTGNAMSLPNADGFQGFGPGSYFYAGTRIADYAGTANSITLTNFTTAMTPAVMTLLLDNFRYAATGDTPNTSDRTVTFTLSDGGNTGSGGAMTGTITQTVHVVATNDAPFVGTTNAVATPFVEGVNTASSPVVIDSGAGAGDPDNPTLASATVSITGNFQAAEDILAFTNSNATTFGNIAASYDAATGVLTLTSAGATATTTQFQSALRAVTYNNSSQEPTTGNRTISFQVNDGTLSSGVATRLVSVTARNDSPSGTSSTISSDEDSVLILTTAHLGFTDVDGDTLEGVRFGQAPTGGTLYYDSDGDGSAAPAAITTYPTTTYSVADVTAGKLTFVPTSNLAGNGAASINFAVVDNGGTTGGGQNSDISPETLTINLAAVNDVPVVDLNAGTPGLNDTNIYAEASDGSGIGADISVTDADGGNLQGATVTITDPSAGDELFANQPLPGGITISAASTATNLILTGAASAADYSLALGQIGYRNNGEDPSAGGANTNRVINVTINDGITDSLPVTMTMTMFAANDAPVNSVPGAQSGTEDTDLVFSAANSNAITIADPDSASGLSVTLSVGQGILTLGSTAGLGSVTGDGTASVTLTGTVAAINAALDGLAYRGALNYNGSDTLQVNTSDAGESGSGGILTDIDTVAITLAADGVINGSAGDDILTGTGNGDFFDVDQGGDDDLTGLGGNDVFLFGSTFTSADKVDGGDGADQIAIQGDYSEAGVPARPAPGAAGGAVTFGTEVISIESLAILPGSDTRFGDPGTNFYDYDLTMVDENVAAGVTMVVDANRLRVGEDFTFDGSAETDGAFFIYGGGGTDTLTGGANNDTFYFGEGLQFGASDQVDGGSGGIDQLGLRGDYTITFGAGQLISIESIGLVSAYDTRYGVLGTRYDYNLTMNDGNVLAGQQMTVDAAPLRPDETLTFDGSAELDGSFRIFGGRGNDTITGSQGNDRICGGQGGDSLRGGGGNDVFVYRSVLDSLASGDRDGIQDFTTGDQIDLSAIDANETVAGNQAFAFIGADAFSNQAGELRATNNGGIWTIQGDVDGDGIADIQFFVVRGDANPMAGTDFVL